MLQGLVSRERRQRQGKITRQVQELIAARIGVV
jgi:hypothetical protein